MSSPNRIQGAACIQILSCDLASIGDGARILCEFLSQQGLGDEEVSVWKLLCMEAGSNAVLHGQPSATQQPVTMTALVSTTLVELQVEDHSVGFEFPENPGLPHELSENGRGLFLIRSLSDEVSYFHGRQSNLLVLRRRRTVSAPPIAARQSIVNSGDDEALLQTMSEQLAACYESLSAIFRITDEVRHGGHDDQFIDRWLNELQAVASADWWILRLVSPDYMSLVPFATSERLSLPSITLTETEGASVEAQAAFGRQDIWLEPALALSPYDPLRQIGESLTGLCHPIYAGTDLLGVLSIGRRQPGVPFTAGQVNIIHTFGDFMGIQIHNARIQEDHIRSRLIGRDLEIAATIQRSLLPLHLPNPPGFCLLGYSANASQVGGDFYDVLELPEGGLLLAIADVMGKGVPAAMFAAIFRGHLRSRPELASRPGAFLAWLNRAMYSDLDRVDMFVTVQLVFLDFRNREVRMASAGHCPLLVGGRDVPVRELAADGPPLGIFPETNWTEQQVALPDNPCLVLFTDGLMETRDGSGSLLGLERVKAALDASILQRESAEEIRDTLLTLAAGFQGGRVASDDLTLLILTAATRPSQ